MTRYEVRLGGEITVVVTVDVPLADRSTRGDVGVIDHVIERAFTLGPDRLCTRCASEPARRSTRVIGDLEPIEVITDGVTVWRADDHVAVT